MEDKTPVTISEQMLGEVLATLGTYKLRATYGAVAGLLGCTARSLGRSLGERRKETSWIVSARTELPEGYADAQLHPQLTVNEHVVRRSEELGRLVDAWRSIDRRSERHTRPGSQPTVSAKNSVNVGRRVPEVSARDSVRNRIFGIDWSGARKAWKSAWIAQGQMISGKLQLEALLPGERLPGSGSDLHRFLAALVDWVAAQGHAVIGVDCPFGLPQHLVAGESWEEFIENFADRHPSPDRFQEWCVDAAGGRELKRLTDRAAKTPFSPYNLRMYKQTYWGIRGLLSPLVADGRVRVAPMQDPEAGRPLLAEVCPASTLARLGLSGSYKGREPAMRSTREQILDGLVERRLLAIEHTERRTAVENRGGDAIDAILATLAAATVPQEPPERIRASRREYATEGYVYC